MQVASMHFKERAHVKLRRRAAAAQPAEDAGQVRRQAARRRWSSSTTSRARARPRRRSASARSTTSTSGSRSSSATPTARGATVLWAETPADINALVLEIAARHGVREDHQVEVDGVGGVGARPRDRGGRADGRRDRPRRVHPADQRLRAAVAHHRPGAAQVEGGGRRPVPQARTARRRKTDIEELCLEARGVLRAALPDRGHGHLGRQFLRRRDGLGRARHQRRQRDADDDAAEGARRDLRHREDRAHARGRRDADAPPAALGDRPVDLELRRHPDRDRRARASSTAPSTCTSSWSTAGAPACSASDVREALRCIRCGACMNHCPVYQNVGGHSYGWVYPGPIGSILTPMYVGLENALDLPAGVDVVQSVRRRVPGEDSAARPAAQAARAGIRAAACDRGTSAPALRALVVAGARGRGSTARRRSSACALLQLDGADSDGMIRRLPVRRRLDRRARHAGAGGPDVSRALSSERTQRRHRDERAACTRALTVPPAVARAPSRSAPRTRSSCWPKSTRWSRRARDIVSFCIGQPDFPTPPNVQDAAIAAIRGGKHGYTPSAGIDELRAAAATGHRRAARPRHSARRTSSSARAPSRSSPTRSRRSPTTAPATK